MTRSWSPFAGAIAGGLLLGLFARAEAALVPLGFVGLVPWLLALDGARSAASALGSAVVAAAVFTATGFAWFPAAVAGYSGGSIALAWTVALLLAPVLLAPQFLALAAARHLAVRLGGGRALVGAVAAFTWVGAEWALPRLFADTLGYGLHPWSAMRQAADLAGARGLTLLLLLANECVAAAIVARRRRPLLVLAGLMVPALVYGALRGRQIEAAARAADAFTAAVVQANITRYDKLAASRGTFAAVSEILDTHFALSRQVIEAGAAPPDLLVWPETVYPTTFGAPRTEEAATFDRAIVDMVETTSVPLVFGAFEQGDGEEFNAAFFLRPRPREGGIVTDSYRKTILFPMTEYVPSWLDAPWLRRALPWAGRWTPGPGPRTIRFALRGGSPLDVVPLICYEVTEPGHVAAAARGADLIVTISNDAWFPDEVGPRLHLLVAAFRSVETRLPQIRATNSGLSAYISPTGELAATTDFGERTAFRIEVPRPPPTRTLVLAWGDWLGMPSLATAFALLVWAWRRARQTRQARDRVVPPGPRRGRRGSGASVGC